MTDKRKKYKAPALEKGLDILEYLSTEARSLSQTEIADGVNRSTNEIYRMLVCLESMGYVMRDDVSGNYRLSLKLYNLSHRHSPVDEILKVSQYPMQELSDKTKQSCHLSTVYNDKLMVIYQTKSPGPISLSIEEGSLFSLINTSSGRLLLASMSEAKREATLNRVQSYQDYSAKEKKDFLKSLEKIQQRGYAAGESDLTQGVTDIVVPIGSTDSFVSTCLAVSALTNQIDESISLREIIRKAKKTAQTIWKRLGDGQ